MTASGMAGRLNTTGDTTVSMQEDSDEQQEVIEVQILPQVRPQTWQLLTSKDTIKCVVDNIEYGHDQSYKANFGIYPISIGAKM